VYFSDTRTECYQNISSSLKLQSKPAKSLLPVEWLSESESCLSHGST